MTHEWNIARVRQLVGWLVGRSIRPSAHGSSLSGNPIWQTSKAVERSDLPEKQAGDLSVFQESSSFVPRRGASYFQLILENCPWKPSSSEKYIFPRTRLSSFHSDYLRHRAVDRSRRKVEKEIRSHVSRINFSLALDVLLFSIR